MPAMVALICTTPALKRQENQSSRPTSAAEFRNQPISKKKRRRRRRRRKRRRGGEEIIIIIIIIWEPGMAYTCNPGRGRETAAVKTSSYRAN